MLDERACFLQALIEPALVVNILWFAIFCPLPGQVPLTYGCSLCCRTRHCLPPTTACRIDGLYRIQWFQECTALQSQKAVTAYLTSKQLLLFFVVSINSQINGHRTVYGGRSCLIETTVLLTGIIEYCTIVNVCWMVMTEVMNVILIESLVICMMKVSNFA